MDETKTSAHKLNLTQRTNCFNVLVRHGDGELIVFYRALVEMLCHIDDCS